MNTYVICFCGEIKEKYHVGTTSYLELYCVQAGWVFTVHTWHLVRLSVTSHVLTLTLHYIYYKIVASLLMFWHQSIFLGGIFFFPSHILTSVHIIFVRLLFFLSHSDISQNVRRKTTIWFLQDCCFPTHILTSVHVLGKLMCLLSCSDIIPYFLAKLLCSFSCSDMNPSWFCKICCVPSDLLTWILAWFHYFGIGSFPEKKAGCENRQTQTCTSQLQVFAVNLHNRILCFVNLYNRKDLLARLQGCASWSGSLEYVFYIKASFRIFIDDVLKYTDPKKKHHLKIQIVYV